jgi:Arc/MetJ-type ribon-helix-helix transcriptional regulator
MEQILSEQMAIDLGQIDLMVQEGFYSNRTDFIRAAIRNQIERHGDALSGRQRTGAWISACGTTVARISKRPGRARASSN